MYADMNFLKPYFSLYNGPDFQGSGMTTSRILASHQLTLSQG